MQKGTRAGMVVAGVYNPCVDRIDVRTDAPAPEALADAVRVLQAGGLVAFPTETVYGLCVDPRNRAAVERLYAVKGREAAKASAYLLADRAAAERLAGGLPPLAARIADRFWPGPVTLVVPGRREGRWVGLRVPAPALPRRLAAAFGGPLLQTSANRSGEPAALNAAGVRAALGGDIELLLDGGRTPGGRSSTVVRCDARRFGILRRGAVPPAAIVRAATELILVACTGNLCRSPVAEAMLRAELAVRLGCEVSELARHGYRIGSFGTMAMPGYPATDHSVTCAADLGLDLSQHRSRPFSIGLLERAHRVFCMANGHMEFLRPYFDGREDDLQLLDPDGKEIRDPYRKPLKVYRRTTEQIAKAVEARVDEILGIDDDAEE
ncbi:MAG: threonylcarbamoyl-AMP synthase [Deltaproteobacteria bacterium]|nr:MAG: threonylcarbamoyl-AMP synthase [Deltaproteobacteria bacterium]